MSNIPIVRELQEIVLKNNKIKQLLFSSILSASVPQVRSLSNYYIFLERFLNDVPLARSKREFYDTLARFYWFLNNPFGKELQGYGIFSEWVLKFFQYWEDILDEVGSLACLENGDFTNNFKIFNDVITRHMIRVGDNIEDNRELLFPSDGLLKEVCSIRKKASIKVDQLTYSIFDMLEASAYRKQFAYCIFAHIEMKPGDYQRFHIPSNGVVLDIQNIPSIVPFGIKRKSVDKIVATEGRQCQFVQDRSLLVFHNDALGFFALIPIGLVQLSSIKMAIRIGDKLSQGTELGYFRGGGSDMIVLCSNPKIQFTARTKIFYKQGQKMALFT